MQNKLARRLTYLITVPLFVFDVLRFKFTKGDFLTKHLINTFCLLGGKPGSLASKFLASRKVDFQLDSSKSILRSYTLSFRSLEKMGWAVIPNALDSTTVGEILDISEKAKGSYRKTDSGEIIENEFYFDRKNPQSVRFDYDSNDLFKYELIQNIVSDRKILNIAQEYLGAQPIFDFIAMWWHVKSENPDKEAAQYFHFDMDRLRWVKFFFYITDVNEESGPHVFIPKSHSDFGLPFKLRSKGYARLEDEDVAKHFPKFEWKVFTGNAGTLIIEDTRGLHKGKHVLSGDRLVFQIQFTSSLFAQSALAKTTIKRHEIGAQLNEALIKFPKIFSRVRVIN